MEDSDVAGIDKPALLLNGRNILSNGNIDYSSAIKVVNLQELDKVTLEKYLVKPGDILIPSISRKLDAIAIASQEITPPLLFSNTLIRIRISPQKADPLLVFSFIRSDIGKSLLKRNTSSFLLDDFKISVKGISESTIFLPSLSDQESSGKDVESEFSYLTSAIRQLKDEVLPQLQDLNQPEKSQFTHREELAEVSFELRRIASSLTSKPLSARVLSEYPMPVALAYRRFYDSRFNVYEKTQRLRDLFEASFIFVYNLILADWLKNLDSKDYYIEDNGARRAYQTFSLARKNDFLKHIIKIAKINRGRDLFMPEIANSSLTDLFDSLKELRNHLSHSATATKSKQEKILSDNEPVILDVLEELDFLRDYRLVRVPLSYRKGGREIYRMEVYKGVAPQLEEKPIEEDIQSEDLKMAEHDHLILLRNDGKILDLHPLYQLVDNETTQYQPHICFFKQRSEVCQSDNHNAEKLIILKGESINSSETISLKGTEEFEKMIERILKTKPEQ